MKRIGCILNSIICFVLLVSCSQVQNLPVVQTQTQTITKETPTAPVLASATSEEKIIPTNTHTPDPTSTPTKTEIVPALNGTPSPAFDRIIDTSSIQNVQVLRRTGTQRSIIVLGKNGDRWFIDSGKDLKFYDTKTSELIWTTDTSPNSFLVNEEGSIVFKSQQSDDFFEIVKDSGESRKYPIPDFDKMPNGWRSAVNYQKELIAIQSATLDSINVYKWGDTTPVYSKKGGLDAFSTNGEYLTYAVGFNLQIADAETGKLVTEFNFLKGAQAGWKTSWDDKYLAIARESTVEIWQLADRKLVRILQEKSDVLGQAFLFRFSEDNQFIMVLQPGKTIRTWSISSGVLIEEEKTKINDLYRVGITSEGKIKHYSLPQVPGRTWETEFSDKVIMTFAKDSDILFFAHQLLKAFWVPTDNCTWDLLAAPSCSFNLQNWTYTRAWFQILALGNDNEPYFLRPYANPVPIFSGWEREGKFLTQLPDTTIGVDDFTYDPETGLILSEGSNGQCYIFNRKTRSRLLIDGKLNQFIISKDGTSLLALLNNKEDPTMMDFVQFDSQTLKEVSRTNLGQMGQSFTMEETGEKLTPAIISSTLTQDGKNIYVSLNYFTKDLKKLKRTFFLKVPLDSVEESMLIDLEIDSKQLSNLVVNNQGDLAIIAQTENGDVHYIDTETGKVLYTLHVGGNPIKLALKPDGKILAVADVKEGIMLLGIPGE
jgi:hypothetical protein